MAAKSNPVTKGKTPFVKGDAKDKSPAKGKPWASKGKKSSKKGL
jgi:hypothetical protein